MQDNWNKLYEEYEKLLRESQVNLDELGYDKLQEEYGITKEELELLEKETFKSLTSQKLMVKKVHPDAIFPEYVYEGDSGFDLFSVEEVIMTPMSRMLVSTGLALGIPNGYEIQIRPKSGLALKQGLTVLNTPGTVDSGYLGEIKVILFNTSNETVKIEKSTKIAQACLCPVVSGKHVIFEETDELTEKDRGENGFGSTGLGKIF